MNVGTLALVALLAIASATVGVAGQTCKQHTCYQGIGLKVIQGLDAVFVRKENPGAISCPIGGACSDKLCCRQQPLITTCRSVTQASCSYSMYKPDDDIVCGTECTPLKCCLASRGGCTRGNRPDCDATKVLRPNGFYCAVFQCTIDECCMDPPGNAICGNFFNDIGCEAVDNSRPFKSKPDDYACKEENGPDYNTAKECTNSDCCSSTQPGRCTQDTGASPRPQCDATKVLKKDFTCASEECTIDECCETPPETETCGLFNCPDDLPFKSNKENHACKVFNGYAVGTSKDCHESICCSLPPACGGFECPANVPYPSQPADYKCRSELVGNTDGPFMPCDEAICCTSTPPSMSVSPAVLSASPVTTPSATVQTLCDDISMCSSANRPIVMVPGESRLQCANEASSTVKCGVDACCTAKAGAGQGDGTEGAAAEKDSGAMVVVAAVVAVGLFFVVLVLYLRHRRRKAIELHVASTNATPIHI